MNLLSLDLLNVFGRETILHVGPPKTGSSAIQEALNRSRSLLAASSIYYPEHETDVNSISSGHLHTLLTYNNHQSRWLVSRRKLAALVTRFISSRCTRLLLSSEFFATKDLLLSLSRSLPHTSVVAYVRDPISLVNSEYVQSVKRSGNKHPFDLCLDDPFDPWFYKRLEDCAYSSAAIHYFSYDLGTPPNTSILDPILARLSYNGPAIRLKPVNLSYTYESLEFKRASNHYLNASQLNRLDTILQACRIGLSNYSVLSCAQSEHVMSSIDQYISKLSAISSTELLADELRRCQSHAFEKLRSLTQEPTISLECMRAIALHIKDIDPDLHCSLVESVRSSPSFETVPDDFFRAIAE